jgi:fermentation-respiration switch protein FrsA (DUF1100 family)
VSAILSAARTPKIEAVVAVAPFTCVDEIWQTSKPPFVPGFILDWALWVSEVRSGFDRQQVCPVDVVDQLAPRPLLIVHGLDDRRITESQVRRLYDAARQPKALWLVEGASHDGIRTQWLDDQTGAIIGFFDTAIGAEATQRRGRPQPSQGLAARP